MSIYFAFTVHKHPLLLISVTTSKCVIHKKQSLHWYLISESDMIQYACQGKKCSPPSLNPGICPGSLAVYYHWLNGLLESNSRQACIQRRFSIIYRGKKNLLFVSLCSFGDHNYTLFRMAVSSCADLKKPLSDRLRVCFIGRRLTKHVWIPACS